MDDATPAIGRRVVVTGLAGSGKSTFSRALRSKRAANELLDRLPGGRMPAVED